MTTTRIITDLTIYWDAQDPANEGWAYRAIDSTGHEESGGIDADPDDLDDAIREACRFLGIDLTPDQFAREPRIDGGYATWTGGEYLVGDAASELTDAIERFREVRVWHVTGHGYLASTGSKGCWGYHSTPEKAVAALLREHGGQST